MNGQQQIDLNNVSDCIKTANNIGNTVYINICTGQSHVVYWGNLDWGQIIFMVAFIVGVLSLISKVTK